MCLPRPAEPQLGSELLLRGSRDGANAATSYQCLPVLSQLDGELVILDGVAYQQAASGACRVVGPDEKVGERCRCC